MFSNVITDISFQLKEMDSFPSPQKQIEHVINET